MPGGMRKLGGKSTCGDTGDGGKATPEGEGVVVVVVVVVVCDGAPDAGVVVVVVLAVSAGICEMNDGEVVPSG